jgi:hypothetical protein
LAVVDPEPTCDGPIREIRLSFSILLVVLEFADKLGLRLAPKSAFSMFLVVLPKTIVGLAGALDHRAHAVSHPLMPLTVVISPIYVKAATLPVALVILPFARVLVKSSPVGSLRHKSAFSISNNTELIARWFEFAFVEIPV